MAAQLSAAYAHTSYDLGLVSYTYLPELYPGMEGGGQVLQKLPEIHPSVSGEIEKELAPVKCVF